MRPLSSWSPFRALVGVLPILLVPRPTPGASFLEMAGAPPSGHPFAGRILPGGPDTAYFNPALLPEVPKQFSLGLFYLWQDLEISLDDRTPGADIPESIYGARIPDGQGGTRRLADRPIPTGLLPRERGAANDSGGAPVSASGRGDEVLEGAGRPCLFGSPSRGSVPGPASLFPR